MSARGKWQGMITVAQLNWPLYAAAFAVLLGSLGGLFLISMPELRLVCWLALANAAYSLLGSLSVTHFIYDRSDLYRWNWLQRALSGADRRSIIFCHSGFDEASQSLREKLGNVRLQVLDHFDELQMTEASIRRARRMFPPTSNTLPAPYNQWPVETGSADVVFGVLAIHELRSDAERSEWFLEAKRSLRKAGRIVLVEHIRDLANLLAFGPGFLHFHSWESWRRSWQHAGFRCLDEFCITPWVRVFVLVAS